MFVPFEDGSSVQLWEDDDRCEAEVRRFAPKDVAGWRAMKAVKDRLRDLLRPDDARDVWIGPSPSREALERLLGDDAEARALLFEWSMIDMVERYLDDERLQLAYLGQGVVGTNASPFDAGTASVLFHHASGRMEGQPGTWGYVDGGMGMVSFLLCDIARRPARPWRPVYRSGIVPVRSGLASGERIRAPRVVSNADPRKTLGLLDGAADAGGPSGAGDPDRGVTVKVNMTLTELPNFTASRHQRAPSHGAGQHAAVQGRVARVPPSGQRGVPPPRTWCELYLQTVFDPRSRPKVHTLSVFAQPCPTGSRRKLGHPARGWGRVARSPGSAATRPGRSRPSTCWAADRTPRRTHRRAHLQGIPGLHVDRRPRRAPRCPACSVRRGDVPGGA
jgi:phytoene dehydrogenase-like protein